MIARFTQEDVYRGDGLNLYAYCDNNPAMYYDPSGYAKHLKDAVGKGKTEGSNSSEVKVGEYLSNKAPNQVAPGTRQLKGQYVDNLGRVQPWKAHYDKYGRLIGRTDYNAGNKAQGIPDTHYHRYEWGPGKTPYESESHIKGEYKP